MSFKIPEPITAEKIMAIRCVKNNEREPAAITWLKKYVSNYIAELIVKKFGFTEKIGKDQYGQEVLSCSVKVYVFDENTLRKLLKKHRHYVLFEEKYDAGDIR